MQLLCSVLRKWVPLSIISNNPNTIYNHNNQFIVYNLICYNIVWGRKFTGVCLGLFSNSYVMSNRLDNLNFGKYSVHNKLPHSNHKPTQCFQWKSFQDYFKIDWMYSCLYRLPLAVTSGDVVKVSPVWISQRKRGIEVRLCVVARKDPNP